MALAEYIPVAPIHDQAREHNENLPGMGGVFDTVNLHVYHYAGIGQRSDSELQANNPVKYTDPDGMFLEVNDNGDGTYTVSGGEANSDKNIYIMKNGKRSGDILGQMLTEYSFFDDDTLV